MKWIAPIVALFTALVSAQAPATKSAAAPAKRPTKQYTMEPFPDTTSIQGGLSEAGDEKDLTPGDKLKAQFGGWTHDGGAFYVVLNERDPKFFDIYRYDARSNARTLFYENKDGYFTGPVSDDEKWLALDRPNTTNDSDVFVWNASTRQVTHITKHTGNANNASQQFDRASKHLYFLSDASGEFTAVRRYSLADGTVEDVQSAPWDVVATTFSHNGKYRATIVDAADLVDAEVVRFRA